MLLFGILPGIILLRTRPCQIIDIHLRLNLQKLFENSSLSNFRKLYGSRSWILLTLLFSLHDISLRSFKIVPFDD